MASDNSFKSWQPFFSTQLHLSEAMGSTYNELQVDGLKLTDKDTKRELQALDLLATALNFHAEDSTAVTLDKRSAVTVVIAKNRSVTQDDTNAVQAFLDLIVKPEVANQKAPGPVVFPYYLRYCSGYMARCIEDFRSSLSDMYSLLEKPIPHSNVTPLQAYKPKSIKEEFPNTEKYIAARFTGKSPTFQQVIQDIIRSGIGYCQNVTLNPQNVKASIDSYSVVCLPAKQLTDCLFLTTVCDEGKAGSLSYLKDSAMLLKQRIDKVRRFRDGISTLLKAVKRTFPNGAIKWRWAQELDWGQTGQGEHAFGADYKTTLSQTLQHATSAQKNHALGGADHRFPTLAADWKRKTGVYSVVHPEIRVIFDQDGTAGKFPGGRAIGCSEFSCACCYLFIDAYNTRQGTSWITTGATGRVESDWAFPGPGLNKQSAISHIDSIQREVYDGVTLRIERLVLYTDQDDTQDDIFDDSAYMAVANMKIE